MFKRKAELGSNVQRSVCNSRPAEETVFSHGGSENPLLSGIFSTTFVVILNNVPHKVRALSL